MACGKAVQFLNYARLSYHSVGVCLTEREMKKHIYIYYTHKHSQTYSHAHSLTYISIRKHLHIHIHVYPCTYIHIDIQAHIHMHRASFAAAGMHGACGASLGHHWVIVRPSIVGPSLGHRWVVVGSSLGWCMVLRHPHGCMGPLGYVGPSWGHHWVIVGSSSGHPWVIIFGSLLGHRWVIIFGSLLGHHWVILGMVCGPETPPQLYGSDARPTESERRMTPAPPSPSDARRPPLVLTEQHQYHAYIM